MAIRLAICASLLIGAMGLTAASLYAQITPPGKRTDANSTFFRREPLAEVTFDVQAKVWTFGNARIRGKLAYDDKQHGFNVVSLKDLKTGLDVVAAPSSGGRFSVRGPSRWASVVDRSTNVPENVKPYSPELYRYPVHAKARFLRLICQSPTHGARNQFAEVEVLVAGKNVAPGKTASAFDTHVIRKGDPKQFLPDKAIDGIDHAKDPGNCWSSKPCGVSWWQIDLGKAHQIDEVRIQYSEAKGEFDCVPKSISMLTSTSHSPDDLPKAEIDLARDFALGGWSVKDSTGIKGGGVRTLEIEAVGVGMNAGTKITICYDLYPGNEPWLTKWFKISAPHFPRDESILLDSVTFDEFSTGTTLAHSHRRRYEAAWRVPCTSLNLVPASPEETHGFMVSNLNYISDVQVAPAKVVLGYRPGYGFREYLAATGGKTTKAFEGLWDGGSLEAAEFQYQVFLVDRYIITNPLATRPTGCLYPTGGYAITDTEAASIYARMGFSGLAHIATYNWAGRAFRSGKVPTVYEPENPKGFPKTMHGLGMNPCLYIGTGPIHSFTDIYPTDLADARAFGEFIGRLSAETGTITWFIEDPPGVHYLGRVGRAQIGPMDAMWREGIRVLFDEMRSSVAPRTISLGRTWVKQLELFDIQDWSSETDYSDQYGWADAWLNAYVRQVPLRPNFTFHCHQPVHVVNSKRILPRPGRKAKGPEDLDFTASRSANMGIMWECVSDDIRKATEEEIAIQKKWIAWHNQNARLLEYTQKLEVEGPLPKGVLGFMHLRPLLDGKYGFVCWWNHSESAVTLAPKVNLRKWMLSIDPKRLVVRSVRTGEIIKHSFEKDVIRLGAIETPMWSYDVLELSGQ